MNALPNLLQKIIATKHEEIRALNETIPFAEWSSRVQDLPPTRDFVGTLQQKITAGGVGVIAEIKKASPSKGIIRPNFDPVAIAQSYATGGQGIQAACLSILTDESYFQGHLDYLMHIRQTCTLPLLRKDFIIDASQIYQARVYGADAILLIAACLSPTQMLELEDLAHSLGLAVLVEIHHPDELPAALALKTPLLGINNRDLKTFEVRLSTTFDLLSHIPSHKCVVTESGIASRQDILQMRQKGVHAFLIGETFMRAPEPGLAMADLLANTHE